jgi:hypothetical protein
MRTQVPVQVGRGCVTVCVGAVEGRHDQNRERTPVGALVLSMFSVALVRLVYGLPEGLPSIDRLRGTLAVLTASDSAVSVPAIVAVGMNIRFLRNLGVPPALAATQGPVTGFISFIAEFVLLVGSAS